MKHLLLALATGLLLAFGWPTYGFPVLLFVAFIPLLYVAHDIKEQQTIKYKGWRLFALSYLAFFIWNFITTNWLQYADMFGACFAILVNSLLMALLILIYQAVAKRTTINKSLLFLITLWICFEKLHLNWEFSWPWLNLGNAFSEYPKWIQWYEFTGAFGGTLWVWLVNGILFKALLTFFKFKENSILKRAAIQTTLLICLPIVFSIVRYYTYTPEEDTIEAVVLQPNIDPYSEKYNATNKRVGELLIQLAEENITENTNLLVSPETVLAENYGVNLPRFNSSSEFFQAKSFVYNYPNLNYLLGLQFYQKHTNKADILPTSNQYNDKLWVDYYNSAAFINADKEPLIYHKSKLVVGVENFPYQSILKPIIGDAMLDLGGTVAMKTTQKERSAFKLKNSEYKVAPVICYESVYGEYVTGYVREGANVLAIMTNDAWWGNTQGHKQHLSYARLRAIETRRAIARSANTGISAFISPKGDIIKTLAYEEQGSLKARIPVNTNITFYVQAGDYIARISMFLALGLFVITFFRRDRV
ncbi:apolipoprotein N-acyltransferase [Formosa agariphila KMM 3901]|uniref:Apolipoprotein N-acyltransferase n=1 Tax=Formosa agariphila (strain DSM 15362 / KCTC 12365 / LMG 23005 / KMM 3901 / M-2Alg 35-1) TaxID=1347342 RepID=T2KLB6_FORAG|nr:apolipoprotein N-acyltransferase [Formosa agariphila]CDF78784.1 apolipoprotein N-acyltransferase [Formosa agariphila KMM 3901]